jgi:DNA-binding protein HU-beta
MNRGQLVDQLALRTGLPRPVADAAVRAIFDPAHGILVEELRSTGKASVSGFGDFEVRERGARTGRDPRNGEAIQIPARSSCTFKPRKGLRSSMKDMIGA